MAHTQKHQLERATATVGESVALYLHNNIQFVTHRHPFLTGHPYLICLMLFCKAATSSTTQQAAGLQSMHLNMYLNMYLNMQLVRRCGAAALASLSSCVVEHLMCREWCTCISWPGPEQHTCHVSKGLSQGRMQVCEQCLVARHHVVCKGLQGNLRGLVGAPGCVAPSLQLHIRSQA